jgi:hypothetical protein
MLTADTIRASPSDHIRGARLAQLGMLQEVRRPVIDVDRLRQRLACAFLIHGWLMVRPEPTMAFITRIAGGPSLN